MTVAKQSRYKIQLLLITTKLKRNYNKNGLLFDDKPAQLGFSRINADREFRMNADCLSSVIIC